MPRITQKGQITIPLEIRKKFALVPGSEVDFTIRNDEIIIVKSSMENKFLKWLGAGGTQSQEHIDTMVEQLRGRSDE